MGSTGKTLIILAALVVIAAAIKTAEDLMVPFLLAAFISTIAATPVFWLERRRVPTGLAIALVMAGFIALIVGVGAVVAQSVGAFTARLPFYQERLGQTLQDLTAWAAPFGLELSADTLQSYFDPATALVLAGNTLSGLGGALTNGFLILLTVIFILAEAASFPRKLADVLKNPEQDLPRYALFAENVNRYMGIKTSVSLITGIIVGVFLAILGVDFPVLWGLLAFLLNYIPNIGSIIAAVPAVLLALIQFGALQAAVTAGLFLAVNVVMGNAVEPKFMGKGLGLSTLVVFLSLVFWGWMLGPVGMLLSVPLTMTAKMALEANPSSAWLAQLLGPAEPQALPAAEAASSEGP